MKAEPHVHDAKLVREYPIGGYGNWELNYGDTTVRVCGEWRIPSDRDVRRALKRAVSQHDKGSLKAAVKVEQKKAATEVLAVFNSGRKPDAWGSEVLREKGI